MRLARRVATSSCSSLLRRARCRRRGGSWASSLASGSHSPLTGRFRGCYHSPLCSDTLRPRSHLRLRSHRGRSWCHSALQLQRGWCSGSTLPCSQAAKTPSRPCDTSRSVRLGSTFVGFTTQPLAQRNLDTNLIALEPKCARRASGYARNRKVEAHHLPLHPARPPNEQ